MHQIVYWCLDDIVLVLPAFGTTLGSSVGFDNTIRCVGHLVQTRFGGMIFMHRTEQNRYEHKHICMYINYIRIYVVYISMIGDLFNCQKRIPRGKLNEKRRDTCEFVIPATRWGLSTSVQLLWWSIYTSFWKLRRGVPQGYGQDCPLATVLGTP